MAERFINAAKDGYIDLLREATRKDLNTPDEDGMTATLWAAHTGNLEALRLIVGREGDVDKADYLGLTALHHAAVRGHMGVVSYLVNWGCNIYALDNDLHSALDLASINDRHEIVRFLDNELAQRQSKNPRQVSKLKEEAIKSAESNIKRYEKLQELAAKRAEKEQKKLHKESADREVNAPRKKSFFQSLSVRMKGSPLTVSSSKQDVPFSNRKYSDFSMTTGNSKGLAKKLQMKRLENLTPGVDSDNRSLRAYNTGQFYRGSTSEVMYMTANREPPGQENTNKRPSISADTFYKGNNVYRAKSESDLLADSGVDSYNGEEEDDENGPGIFNRPEFGKIAFFGKTPFINTLQSFDDRSVVSPDDLDDDHLRSSYFKEDPQREGDDGAGKTLPWDQDDIGNLDDDEEDANELSAVNMFLWSCGLASYLHIFAQEKIDMSLLTSMTDAELKDLGLPFGPRKKLRDALARRNLVLQSAGRMTDSFL